MCTKMPPSVNLDFFRSATVETLVAWVRSCRDVVDKEDYEDFMVYEYEDERIRTITTRLCQTLLQNNLASYVPNTMVLHSTSERKTNKAAVVVSASTSTDTSVDTVSCPVSALWSSRLRELQVDEQTDVGQAFKCLAGHLQRDEGVVAELLKVKSFTGKVEHLAKKGYLDENGTHALVQNSKFAERVLDSVLTMVHEGLDGKLGPSLPLLKRDVNTLAERVIDPDLKKSVVTLLSNAYTPALPTKADLKTSVGTLVTYLKNCRTVTGRVKNTGARALSKLWPAFTRRKSASAKLVVPVPSCNSTWKKDLVTLKMIHAAL